MKDSRYRMISYIVSLLFVLAIPVLARPFKLRLTGNAITSSFVQEQLENVFENIYGVKPEIKSFPQFSLDPNETKEFKVSIAPHPGNFEQLDLQVSSEKAPPFRDALLLFSNHPEVLRDDGLLFSAGMIFLRPVRLNYYHQNGAEEPPRFLTIRVDNKNDSPAFLHILEARSGPSKDEMSTGHQASLVFLHRHFENLGRIEKILPNDTLILSRQMVGPGELVTGFLEVEELKGHPLAIAVFAEDPKRIVQRHKFLLESEDTHARGAYEMSKLNFRGAYRVGDPPSVIPLGDLPLRNLLPGSPLKGAYGMLWEGDLELENPYSTTESVPIYFQPRGGAATATFILNNIYKEIPVSKPYQNPMLLEFLIPPNSNKKIHVLTMPEGGSNYPVYLILGRTSP